MIPTLFELVDAARRAHSDSTDEWLEKRLPLLLRAIATEHPEIASLLSDAAVFGESTRRGRLHLQIATPPLERVLGEVADERARQEAKFGRQDCPWHVPGLSVEAVRAELQIPTGDDARGYVEALTQHGLLSYSAILYEEVAEAIECSDDALARKELIQVAAVAVAAVEAIDRRLPPSSPVPPASAGSAPDLSDAAGSGGGSRSPTCPDCRGSGQSGPWPATCLTCAGEGLLGGGR